MNSKVPPPDVVAPSASNIGSALALAAQSQTAGEHASVQTLAAAVDLTRYTEPMSVWEALTKGHVRLVKMSWIIEWSKAGKILARRQDLPEEAFISVDELKALYGKGNRDGVLPIIAISFCWLTPQHPDPEGKQLAMVAAQLEREKAKYGTLFSEMGIFWDWLGIYQKDPMLFDRAETPDAKPEQERAKFVEDLKARRKFYGGEEYERSRTDAQKVSFSVALHETMDLWYAHQGTTVYMLTRLPEGSTRKVGYSDSGWTTYERCSAEQIKKFFLFEAEWKLVLDLGAGEGNEAQRNWPMGPDEFDTMVESKTFTNGADRDAVKSLFRKMSINQLGGITMLDFDGMSSPTVTDARQLGRCLNLCRNLEKLDLCRVGMGADACMELFSTLAGGAMAQLTVSWRLAGLSPCREPRRAPSPDWEDALVGVEYAGT